MGLHRCDLVVFSVHESPVGRALCSAGLRFKVYTLSVPPIGCQEGETTGGMACRQFAGDEH